MQIEFRVLKFGVLRSVESCVLSRFQRALMNDAFVDEISVDTVENGPFQMSGIEVAISASNDQIGRTSCRVGHDGGDEGDPGVRRKPRGTVRDAVRP